MNQSANPEGFGEHERKPSGAAERDPSEFAETPALSDQPDGPASRSALADGGSDLIRAKVLEYHRFKHQHRGDVLKLGPTWTRWTYWVLLLILGAGLFYTFFGKVPEYAEGPAVILFNKQTYLTAPREAIVKRIRVPVDHHIRDEGRGSRLVQLYYPQPPRNYQWLKAPHAGKISEIRIHEGQRLLPGESVLSVFPDDAELEVIGILPGHYRPQIRRGMSLRLELAGYEDVDKRLPIECVGDEIVGPDAVRRYLGREIADAMPLTGPVVLVRSKLRCMTFVSHGHSYDYHHGMQGTAAVRVRSERIVYTLAPWLKAAFGNTDD